MKRILSLIVSLAVFISASSKEPVTKTNQVSFYAVSEAYLKIIEDEGNGYPLSKFALSVNPLGFVQFGPLVNIEVGLTKSLVLNAHVRFTSVGLLSYAINYHEDGLEKLSGIAFGGGLLNFFGKKRSKPYAGVLLEYEMLKKYYAKDDPWEWEQSDNTGVFVLNGGYRFRFKSGFFINTGAYLGAALTSYTWEYTDPDYVPYEDKTYEGIDITPFGMVEVTLGIEF